MRVVNAFVSFWRSEAVPLPYGGCTRYCMKEPERVWFISLFCIPATALPCRWSKGAKRPVRYHAGFAHVTTVCDCGI
jgi:hypothetical protein